MSRIDHYVFVDFENVPSVDLAMIAGKPVHATVLIGHKQTKLDTSFSLQLHKHSAQVTPVEVGASGRNALDITLACYLGEAIAQAAGAGFYIVSKDKDFDPAIAHLRAKGVKVSRHDAFAALPFLAAPTRKSAATKSPAKSRSTEKLEKLIAHLRNSPPSNRTKLEHVIESFFKPTLPAGGKRGIVAELIRRGILTVDAANKVVLHTPPLGHPSS